MARVLIVDDAAPIRRVLGNMVATILGGDVEIVEAATAAEALEAARRARADVAILDIMLGEGPDGADVMRGLHEEDPSLPVVVCTALPREHEASIRAISVGASAFVSKPVSIDQLRAALAQAAGLGVERRVYRVGLQEDRAPRTKE